MIYFNTSEKYAAENQKTSPSPHDSHYLSHRYARVEQRGFLSCFVFVFGRSRRFFSGSWVQTTGKKTQKKTNKSPSQEAFLRYSGF